MFLWRSPRGLGPRASRRLDEPRGPSHFGMARIVTRAASIATFFGHTTEQCESYASAAWYKYPGVIQPGPFFYSFPTGGNEHGRHGTDGAAHFFLQGIHKNTGQSSDWNRAPSLGRHNDVVEFCHEKIYKGRAFLLHCFSFRTARNSPGPRRVRKSGAFGKRTNQKEKAKKAQHQEEDIEGPPRQTQRKARLVRFFDTGAA